MTDAMARSIASQIEGADMNPPPVRRVVLRCSKCGHDQTVESACASLMGGVWHFYFGSRFDFCDKCDGPVSAVASAELPAAPSAPSWTFEEVWPKLPIPGEYDAMDALDKERWRGVVEEAFDAGRMGPDYREMGEYCADEARRRKRERLFG